jgi:hypothetical protein
MKTAVRNVKVGARLRSAPDGGFTLRDEANALTAFAFRNGFLEDLHAGAISIASRPRLQPHFRRRDATSDD